MSELVLPESSDIYKAFKGMVASRKIVLFAGLPGVGKSLYLQQLSLMAHRAGRPVHLLQWDVTRSAFETEAILKKYPEVDGVTHAAIRKAVGLWARSGIDIWFQAHKGSNDILIGEVPLLGNRLIELVQVFDDGIEPVLAGEETLFVLPVPSKRLRNMIENTREKTISSPSHERERADAPPNVLKMLWLDLAALAVNLGISQEAGSDYQPDVYARVYETLLKNRYSLTLPLDEAYKVSGSVYDLDVVRSELLASPVEVETIMQKVETEYSGEGLERAVSSWYRL
ncbi:MAG: hypothetical protein KC422_02470 [Trueperaceae bacterium]|nr:hypothetical protein [Trueperaceae bacterium]